MLSGVGEWSAWRHDQRSRGAWKRKSIPPWMRGAQKWILACIRQQPAVTGQKSDGFEDTRAAVSLMRGCFNIVDTDRHHGVR